MLSLGSFNKLKEKLAATRFFFTIDIHSLQPWPSSNRAIAVGYKRGDRRRGVTRLATPFPARQGQGSVVRFNESFEIPVTLYRDTSSSGGASNEAPKKLGPFRKKCLAFVVLETDVITQETAALGRVVIDLSEFAADDHTETRKFLVSCTKQVHDDVGEPQLLVTVRCRRTPAASLQPSSSQAQPEEHIAESIHATVGSGSSPSEYDTLGSPNSNMAVSPRSEG